MMEILDDVHLRVGLTHSFAYYNGCDFTPTNGIRQSLVSSIINGGGGNASFITMNSLQSML